MSPRRTILLVLAGAAVHAGLATGLLGALAAPFRIVLAFGVLLLLPGYAIVGLLAPPPGGWALAAGWAMGFGVAWNAVLLAATMALGVPFTVLVIGALPLNFALWSLVLRRGRRRDAEPSQAPDPPPLARGPVLAIALAAALAVLHTARLGAPLSVYSDSPDHIGTIRRMLASGDPFPRDAFFRDAGASGADPRKAFWQPQVALIARLARVDPVETWRFLPACAAPLFVLNAAALGVLLRGPAGAVATAWALLLTYGGSLGALPLREAAVATKLADQLALATAVAVLADLQSPALALRLAAVVLATGAVATHVFSGIEFPIMFGALLLALVIRDRGFGARPRRLLGTALAIGLACAPWLLVRAMQSHGARNIIHTEPQGLLWLADHIQVVALWVLWTWMGIAWLVIPPSWPALWREGARRPAALFLFSTSLGVALVIFNPIAVAVLSPRIGYLLMRIVWMVPLAGILGWMVSGLVLALRSPGAAGRARAAVGLLGVLAVTAPALSQDVQALFWPERSVAAEQVESPFPWRDALLWMERHLPPGAVVLSDPTTSYTVPMFTRLYVATLVDQHSSPNDERALTRILDARDALDPYGSWDRTREVIHRYGVNVVALNNRFEQPLALDYWNARPEWFAPARARLDAEPRAFERVYDSGNFVVYRVHDAALDSLRGSARTRPFVRRFDPGHSPVARRMGEGLPVLQNLILWPREAAPGDTLNVIADWRVLAPLPPRSYRIALRFDTSMPGGFAPPGLFAKPVRKLAERLQGERYRFRVDHLPVAGRYGVDLWRPDEVVRDSFQLEIPADMAEGEYTVRVKILSQPHYPNYRLSDYFSDQDYYAGIPWTRIRVLRHPESGSARACGSRPGSASPLDGGH